MHLLGLRIDVPLRVDVAVEMLRPVGSRSSISMQAISITRWPDLGSSPVVSVSRTISRAMTLKMGCVGRLRLESTWRPSSGSCHFGSAASANPDRKARATPRAPDSCAASKALSRIDDEIGAWRAFRRPASGAPEWPSSFSTVISGACPSTRSSLKLCGAHETTATARHSPCRRSVSNNRGTSSTTTFALCRSGLARKTLCRLRAHQGMDDSFQAFSTLRDR